MQPLTHLPRVVAAVAALSTLAACGDGRGSSPPPATSPGAGAVQVNGTEKIGWDQSATNVADLQSLTFVVIVDGVQGTLGGASCDTSAGTEGFPCAAPLPPLTNGQHTLQLAAVRTSNGTTVQSEPSNALTVLMVGATNVSSGRGRDPLRYSDLENPSGTDRKSSGTDANRGPADDHVTIVTDQLHAPTAVAPAPDGRVFVAARDRIVVIDNGTLRPEPSLLLNTPGAAGEAGLPDLTLDPGFAANHLVWSSQVVDDGRRRVARITRYTEISGTLGELAVVAELPVGSTAGRTRIRIGPDAKLYISIANLADAGRDSAYEGSIVRLERDGTTPSDNPSHAPVLSAGVGDVRAIAWTAGSADMWTLVTRNGANMIETASLQARPLDAGRMSLSAPRRYPIDLTANLTAFAFLPGTAALAAVAASPERQSLYRLAWRGDTLLAPVPMLARRFGALREVGVGPDGSIYATTANEANSDTRGGDLLVRVLPR